MRKPYFCAVIGKNFGDEGKGLAVDFLSDVPGKVLVVRHNGGAQSGHTVDRPDKRFVFHELSSGSFCHADTFWADTYFPDLYKLGEEMDAFYETAGFYPDIYADENARITIIDDVLLNMAAESVRGSHRHGSCGMGIYEAQCRSEAGFAITIKELLAWTEEECLEKLREIRSVYLPRRLKELWEEISVQLQKTELYDNSQERVSKTETLKALQSAAECQDMRNVLPEEYAELLQSDAVLENAVKEIFRNLNYIKPVSDVSSFVRNYDRVIFENGQGLLLDSENKEFSPHVTASRTGLTNPCELLKRWAFTLDEAVYVTRSYVTRHGAGPLPCECDGVELGIMEEDHTNLENPWQGGLRYARHESVERFVAAVQEDLKNVPEHHFLPALQSGKKYHYPEPLCSLMITHLNETGNCVLCNERDYPIGKFCDLPDVRTTFDRFYLSSTRYAKDTKIMK